MILKKIKAIRYNQDLKSSFQNSRNSYNQRSGYIIKLYIDQHCGCGEASPLPFFSKENLSQIEWAIEELKAGLLINHEYSVSELLFLFSVFAKDYPSLNFALDFALYDVLSKKKNSSIAKYLNKNALSSVQFSAIDFNNIQKNSTIKLKLGIKDLKSDIKFIENISNKYPNLLFRIDFNRCCSLDDAIFACNKLEKINIEYVEEPLENVSFNNYKILKQATVIPLALDETVIEGNHADLIDSNFIDYIVLKPSLFGSINAIRKFHRYLSENNVELIFSSSLQTKIGNMAEIHLASSLGLCVEHGLNNHKFFKGCDYLYGKNDHICNLQSVIGLGVCWDD